MNSFRITGLVPAVFTPMRSDGSVNLELIGPITDRLVAEGVGGLYVCGSTGEGPSLSREERMATAAAYLHAAAGRVPVVVQVGHNSLADARALAEHAAALGADAISAVAPSYFKPASLEVLVDTLAEVARAAPGLPFYYYHIPAVTGVHLDMVRLLEVGSERIPTLVGAKYSTTTVYELQACLAARGGRFNLLFGSDEMLLSALVTGVHGAVGSTFNFATPLYRRVVAAFERGDLAEACREQGRAVEMVRVLVDHGANPAIKAMMKLTGLDCGATRLPQRALSAAQEASLRARMEEIGFFEWGRG